jgi:hypothetical protein
MWSLCFMLVPPPVPVTWESRISASWCFQLVTKHFLPIPRYKSPCKAHRSSSLDVSDHLIARGAHLNRSLRSLPWREYLYSFELPMPLDVCSPIRSDALYIWENLHCQAMTRGLQMSHPAATWGCKTNIYFLVEGLSSWFCLNHMQTPRLLAGKHQTKAKRNQAIIRPNSRSSPLDRHG